MVVDKQTVFSDSCSNSLCSISFSTSAQYCRVGVRASNAIGNSTTEYRNIGERSISISNCSALLSNEGAAKLTLSNSALLGLGVIFVAIAIVVTIIILVATKGDPSCWQLLRFTDNKNCIFFQLACYVAVSCSWWYLWCCGWYLWCCGWQWDSSWDCRTVS